MQIKFVQDEDFTNYKKCAMFIGLPYCTFKCEKDCGIKCCQNSPLALAPTVEISIDSLIQQYEKNPFSSAIVFGGLEPLDSWEDLLDFITKFRAKFDDDIVIYTGYKEEEVVDKTNILSSFKNIIVKYGRFIPNQPSRFDDVLGVVLASPNQYAVKL